MQTHSGVVITILALLTTVGAQQWSIVNITTCGVCCSISPSSQTLANGLQLSCLLVTVPEANCSFADTACQCKSKILLALTTACLVENCTMHDQLSRSSSPVSISHAFSNSLVLSKVQAATCDLPHPNYSPELIVIASTLFALAFILITLRLVSRMWVTRTFGSDDWTIALALVRIKVLDKRNPLSGTDITSSSLSHLLPLQFLVRGPASLLGTG